MATVNKALDLRRPKKDGSFPLVLRLVHKRANREIFLGYSFFENEWDTKKGLVKKSCKRFSNITRLNNLFDKKLTEARDTVTRLEDSGELNLLSATDLKKILTGEKDAKYVFQFSQHLIDQYLEAKKVGNAAVYQECLTLMKEFNDEKDFPFERLNYSFLTKLESYYLGRGNKINSLSVRMRTIRAIFNKAIKEKIVEEKYYPFKDYKIKTQKTKKRAIEKEEIDKISNIEDLKDPKFFDAKNYFLLSFYLRGMSFSDMAKLKVKDIVDGRIRYVRSKTHNEFSIKITDQIRKILDYYIQDKEPDDFVLPIIERPHDPVLMRKDIKNRIHTYNKRLKEIGKILGLNTPLTSYCSRHTWASAALKMGVSIELISQGLGHGEIRTTQIYLSGFDDEALDKANEMITG